MSHVGQTAKGLTEAAIEKPSFTAFGVNLGDIVIDGDDFPAYGMQNALRDARMTHLRILEHLVHLVDWPRRDVDLFKEIQPFGGTFFGKDGSQVECAP